MDDLLISINIAGIGLSIVYLRAELLLHRNGKAAELKGQLALREAHIKRIRLKENDVAWQPRTNPSPIQSNVFPALRIFKQQNTPSI
jgi:hypothetical protein